MLFDKFKKKENDSLKETKVELKGESIMDVGRSYTDNNGITRLAKEHPKFNEFAKKINEIDRLYNNVSETKKKLMDEILYSKLGFMLLGGGAVVTLEEFIRTAEPTLASALSLLSFVAGFALTMRNSMNEPIRKAKYEHDSALQDRAAYIIEKDFNKPKPKTEEEK